MRYVLSLLGLCLLSFFFPVRAQGVVIHGGMTNSEDGDPEYDADGTKNGVVVWKSGVVHVVIAYYWTEVAEQTLDDYDEVLEIESGAIVKMAGSFKVDDDGNVTQWSDYIPSGGLSPRLEGDLRINGATITSIQDDSVGGDTNQDGDATNAESAGGYDIELTTDRGELVGMERSSLAHSMSRVTFWEAR